MKQIANLNRTIQFAGIAILVLALGSTIIAVSGQRLLIVQLNARAKDLARQLPAPRTQVNGQRVTTRYFAFYRRSIVIVLAAIARLTNMRSSKPLTHDRSTVEAAT